MKKLFVVSFMLLAFITFATAQQRQGFQNMSVEDRAKAQTDRMETLLTLTAEQKTRIGAIELELNRQMDTRRQNTQGNPEAMRTLRDEMNKSREERYRTVLTADQIRKYLEDLEQQQQRQGQGQRGPGGGGQRPQ